MKIRRRIEAEEGASRNTTAVTDTEICQAEADGVFLADIGRRLRYDSRPPPVIRVRRWLAAARYCPMQAIVVRRRTR